jgi:hypothetical protein
MVAIMVYFKTLFRSFLKRGEEIPINPHPPPAIKYFQLATDNATS